MASIKPRQTGLPTPGRPSGGGSGIPTPGLGTRSRSSSQAGSSLPSSSSAAIDEEYMNLAFKNAVRANDPATHRVSSISSSSSANGSSFGRSQSQGSGLNQSMGRAKTPTFARPASRQSDVGLGNTRSASRAGWVPEVGDAVRIESLGFEGILQYIGDIDGKPGLWAGVELSGGFAGKGKNDGSVAGKQYFTCPPKCGVFVATTKLSPPTVSHPGARPSSVASSRGGRTTPSFTPSTSTAGRITPSSFSVSRGPIGRISYGSGRTTPSTSGRITPSNSTAATGGSPETPALRAARLRVMSKGGSNSTSTSTTRTGMGGLNKSFATPTAKAKPSTINTGNQAPVPVPGVPTPGSRASKYAGMTAKQLSLNKSLSSPISSKSPVTSSLPSPKSTLSPLTVSNTNIPSSVVSPTRIRTKTGVSSSLPGPGSPFSTPKPRLGGTFTVPSSGVGSPTAGNTPKARVPSGVAMPPPPVPLPRFGSGSPMRSVSATSSGSTASLESPTASPTRRARVTDIGLLSSDELEARGKALQERIAGLTGGKVTPSLSSEGSPPQQQQLPPVSPARRGTIVMNGGVRARSRSRSRTATTPAPASPVRRPPSRSAGRSSRPSSVASTRPGSVASGVLGRSGRASVDPSAQLEQMQSRIDALEYENSRLRVKVDDLESGGAVTVAVASGAVAGPSSSSSSPLPSTDETASSSSSAAVELEKQKVVELSAKVEGLESDKNKMGGELRRLEERRAELEVAYDRAEADKERFTLERGELEAAKARLEELNATLQSEKARLGEEKVGLEQEKASAEERNREMEGAKIEVEQKLKKMTVEFEEERRELRERVDELRQAGQETIALYEEKLRQSDVQKYELEDRIVELEAQAASTLSRSTNAKVNGKADGGFGSHHRSSSGASSNTVVSNVDTKSTLEDATPIAQTTSQIDTETLQLQLSHLQNKIASLEDLLDDTKSNHEGEVSAFTARLEKAREREEGLRKEVAELKRELGESQREKERGVREGGRRVMEVEEALRESTLNLEEMRAEVEGLRGELSNMNGLAASTSSVTGELQNKLTEAQIRAEQEKEDFLDEIQRLTDKMADWQERCEKLKRLTEDQSAEIEGLKKKVNRDVTINGNTMQSPSTPSKQEKYDKHELNTAKEEIMGLKHIIQDLQKEMLTASQRNKVLESENQLLISEMEQLRQEVKILEDNLDQSILREEENLTIDGTGNGSSDVDALKQTVKEQRLRADVEIEQLRKKLADVEMKNARTTHDLNKEISELEALVEAKIYREDELEQEVERLKEKLIKHDRKKTSKSSTEPDALLEQSKDAPRPASSFSLSHTSNPSVSLQGTGIVCEICEKPGHDIFNCDLLKEDGPLSAKSMTNAAHKAINGDVEEVDLWCEDCEGHGHSAANCPNSEDVF